MLRNLMKTPLQKIIFVLSFLLASFLGFAEKSFSIEPYFGYSYGTLNEIFYNSNNRNDKVSLLEWDKNIFIYGTNFEAIFNSLHFNADFSTSIKDTTCGKMKDSDWTDEKNTSVKTIYSIGDDINIENYNFLFEVGKRFEIKSFFSLIPIIQGQYCFDSFKRNRGADGWYGTLQGIYDSNGTLIGIKTRDNPIAWDSPEALKFPYKRYDSAKNKYVTGTLDKIEYYRHSVFIWTGIDSQFNYKKISFDLKFLTSIYAYFSAMDTHYQNSTKFNHQQIQDSFLKNYKMSISIGYELTQKLSIYLKNETLIGFTVKGDLYDDKIFNKYQQSGADIFENTSIFCCKITI